MSWDGVPEHRNLHGNEDRLTYLRRVLGDSVRGPAPDPRTTPDGADEMPPDPFTGTLPGAIAQVEMLHSLVEGGMTEPQALYYLACLVQVGLAMRLGRFDTWLPPPPEGL